MSLLAFWEARPEAVARLALSQVITLAGDGALVDGSDGAREFRAFLGLVDADTLKRYVAECLEKAGGGKSRNGFEHSGLALQDIVNEMGRRLGFEVEDGLYRGRVNAIGYDGIWRAPGVELVVEMKTTEAYSFRLETIERYRAKLLQAGRISEDSSTLFVVGRNETGSLEEQIRGSRYAWSMRVIGASALVHLLEVMVKADDEAVAARIRSLMKPVEYTRLDGIVDLVFSVREDVEEPTPDVRDATTDVDPDVSDSEVASGPVHVAPRRQASSLPAPGTEAFREASAGRISQRLGRRLIRRRRSLFETADGDTRVVVAVSKRYDRSYQAYWYAYYDTQKAWLDEVKNAWIALCAIDTEEVYLIPADEMGRHLGMMGETNREEHRAYWHILIRLVDDAFVMVVGDELVPLKPFRLA